MDLTGSATSHNFGSWSSIFTSSFTGDLLYDYLSSQLFYI